MGIQYPSVPLLDFGDGLGPIPTLRTSNSSLSMLQSCARKFEFRKMYAHQHKDDGFAASVGNCLHAAYQEYLISGDEDAALIKLLLSYPMELAHADQNGARDRSLEACYATFQTLKDHAKLGEFELATVNCLDGQVRPAVEVPFEIVLGNFQVSDRYKLRVTYTGYIDAILYNRLEHAFRVVDIKTHRQKMYDLSAKYIFDEQCLPYGIMLEHVLGEQITSFEVSYLSCYVDLENPRTDLYSYHKGQDEIRDWYFGLLLKLGSIGTYLDNDWWPRNSNACIAYNRPCGFLDVCSSRNRELIQRVILQGAEATPNRSTDFEPWVRFVLEVQ